MCCITFNIPHGLSGKNKIDYKVERKPHRPSVGSHSFIHSCIHLFIHLFVYAGLYIYVGPLSCSNSKNGAVLESNPDHIWWEASALTTAPSLLPSSSCQPRHQGFPLEVWKGKSPGDEVAKMQQNPIQSVDRVLKQMVLSCYSV